MTSINGVQTRSLTQVDTALASIEAWAETVAKAGNGQNEVKKDGSLTAKEIGGFITQVRNGNLPPLADAAAAESLANAYANAQKLASPHGIFTREGQQLANGNASNPTGKPEDNDTSIEYNTGNVGGGSKVENWTDTTLRSSKHPITDIADRAERLGELAGGGQASLEQILRTTVGGPDDPFGWSAVDQSLEDTRRTGSLEVATSLAPVPASGRSGPVTEDLLQELGLARPPQAPAAGSPLAGDAGLPFGGLEKFMDETTFKGESGTSWDARKSTSGSDRAAGRFESYDVELTDAQKYADTNNSAKVTVFEDGTIEVAAETYWTRDKDANPNDSEGPFTNKASSYVGDPDKLAQTLIDDLKATMGPVTVTRGGPGHFRITPQE